MNLCNLPKRKFGYDERNLKRIDKLVDDIFDDYSKVLVVRVDFYLGKDYIEDFDNVFMTKALERFRNNMRSNSVFNGFIAYIAKLEYTKDRGWHFHTAFFFNGNERRNEYRVAHDIYDYWCDVITPTVGEGHISFGSNFPRNGTDLAKYDDLDKINDIKYALSYLAKNDENRINKRFTYASGRGIRYFFMSEYRKKESKRGRRRARDILMGLLS